MEKSRSLDTLELSVFFLGLQELLNQQPWDLPCKVPSALLSLRVQALSGCTNRDTQCSFVLVPPGTLRT